MTIPADSLTDDNILFEWLFKVHSEMDVFMNKEEFAIRVLSTPVPIGEGAGTSAAVGHHMFMGRILGIGAPSPHEKYLDDPCELATSDAALTTHLISLHTRFKFFKLSTMQPINVGDVIFGRLEPDRGEDEGAYNLQFARLDRLDFKAAISQNSQPTECSDLSSLDYTMPMSGLSSYRASTSGGTNGTYYKCTGGDAACGPKDDPTFAKCAAPTYDTLPKQATNFQAYSSEEVINAIRASGQPEDVQKIMYAFISKEQPSYRFPNNNVAGIQLDMSSGFGGATQSDFDYQTCFRDNGGDQRIFAGFNSLQGGMVVFGKIIAAKMGKFRTLSGTSNSIDADNLTWNYYRSWNTAFSPEELQQLKTTGRVIRGSETHVRAWGATPSGFVKSLEEWGRI